MKLEFTEEDGDDIERIQTFLVGAGVSNYADIVSDIVNATHNLQTFPRSGKPVTGALPQTEVRDYFHHAYCLRYLVTATHIYILRIWHQKENERSL